MTRHPYEEAILKGQFQTKAPQLWLWYKTVAILANKHDSRSRASSAPSAVLAPVVLSTGTVPVQVLPGYQLVLVLQYLASSYR